MTVIATQYKKREKSIPNGAKEEDRFAEWENEEGQRKVPCPSTQLGGVTRTMEIQRGKNRKKNRKEKREKKGKKRKERKKEKRKKERKKERKHKKIKKKRKPNINKCTSSKW
jgi:hypothetical protein